MKKGVKILIGLAALILIIAGVYFTWFFTYNCKDMECFQANQIKCSRAVVIRETDSTTWQYTIKGKDGEYCVIETKILNIKEGQLDRKILEDKTMDCSLPLESKAFPESDLKKCHGLLKEEIQQIIIKNAHAQIIANIGKVSGSIEQKETDKVIG